MTYCSERRRSEALPTGIGESPIIMKDAAATRLHLRASGTEINR
jgi:hypothetical protein